MKLLYNRVLLEKVIEKEFSEGILKHELSHNHRIAETSKGIVKHIGVDCLEVKPGDVVLYPTNLERVLEIGNEKLVEMREDLILGILPE